MSSLPHSVAQWLPIARAVGPLYSVDPLLILAIVARESLGGDLLQPRGPTGKGDGGHGHGLGQLDDRFNPSLIVAKGPDGRPLWQEPPFAILLVAYFLHIFRRRFDGIVDDPMVPSIACYNASEKRVRERLREVPRPATNEQIVAALDPLTTPSIPGGPGDYVSDVLRRRASFAVT